MTNAATWAGITSIVVTSTAGDVLQSRAMKELGDLDVIRRTRGLMQQAQLPGFC